ncbi:MAG: aldo/keto reductase, partial [Chloroflexi bacterium]|nr:aldo/keto reductase [Chloroflexota bacterium]
MDLQRLGQTDVFLPPMGVGTWAWGDRWYWGYGRDYGRPEVEGAFWASLEAGLNFFDTAEIYGFGTSERILGELIRQSTAQVLIATKFAPYRLTARALQAALDRCLQRLGRERVDLYQIHWAVPHIRIEALMDALAEAARAGKVRAVGVSNFSAGQMVNVSTGEKFKMGGEYITQLNVSRGGEHTHACMPGCVIQCSNVYHDAAGKEVVSPVEYETLGLLGSNCGLTDPDDLAQLNFVANDLGVDTIETGAMLGVLMEAGLGAFGDAKFMAECLAEIRRGTEKGRLWAQGTARVGEHYKVARVPVIKKQAISAY